MICFILIMKQASSTSCHCYFSQGFLARYTDTFFVFFCLGATWEVDLGEGVAVSRVSLFNRNDGDVAHAALVSNRLSNSCVILMNYQGTYLKQYCIEDATNLFMLDLNFAGNTNSASPIADTCVPYSSPECDPSRPCSNGLCCSRYGVSNIMSFLSIILFVQSRYLIVNYAI